MKSRLSSMPYKLLTVVCLGCFFCGLLPFDRSIQHNAYGQDAYIHPFTPGQIADSSQSAIERDQNRSFFKKLSPEEQKNYINSELLSGGAAGVNQGVHGDCWFDASLAAVARTRRGQQAIANMILKKSDDLYVVVFPGRKAVNVNIQDLERDRVHDSALWAQIIEEAALKKFPVKVNHGARAVFGLALLTGGVPKSISIAKCSNQQIVDIIWRCLQAGKPVVVSSKSRSKESNSPVACEHVHTVVSIDPATGLIILRNPWGINPAKNPNQPSFGEEMHGVLNMGAGVVQISVPSLKKYFYRLAYSSWGE